MTSPFGSPFGQPAGAPQPAPATAYGTGPTPQTIPHQPTAPTDPFAGQATGGDPFGAPAPQRGRGPSIENLYTCLILWRPTKFEPNVVSPNLKNKVIDPQTGQERTVPVVQDRMTVDLVVLDAGQNPNGQIPWGGAPYHNSPSLRRPHDKLFDTPGEVRGQFVSQKGLVSQLTDAYEAYRRVGAGQPGTMVLGRLIQGEAKGGNNPPWLIAPFDSLTDDDKAKARAWLQAHPIDQFGAPR